MQVVTRETNKVVGNQALLFDKSTNQHFLLTSVQNPAVNKTFIIKCDANCNVKDWNEVFTVIPSNHDEILSMLENDVLTVKNFNFVNI